MELEELSKLESLLKALQKALQRGPQMERQKALVQHWRMGQAQRWQTELEQRFLVVHCTSVACGAAFRGDVVVDETSVVLNRMLCWNCHPHHSTLQMFRNSPYHISLALYYSLLDDVILTIWNSRSPRRIGSQMCHHIHQQERD